MKIKVESAETAVILTVEYNLWNNEDESWTASPKGVIGADQGRWARAEAPGGDHPILFYGAEPGDKILEFDSAAQNSHGNPFKRWQTGTGRHLSVGGTMSNPSSIEWKVLSM